MNEGLTAFAMWKERGLFLATAATLAAYAVFWVVGSAAGRRERGPDPKEQRYVRGAVLDPFPQGADEVFTSGDPAGSWDPAVPRRWVPPRAEAAVKKAAESVELAPPPATVPAPPMLLPLPGPAPEFTGDLPRWPSGPAPAAATGAARRDDPPPGSDTAAPPAGGIRPVLFTSTPYDTVVIEATGDEIKGELLSEPDAPMVRIRQTVGGRGVFSMARKHVREVRRRLSTEQAHDAVASKIDPTDHIRWHGLALGCLLKRPPLLGKAVADLEKALAASPRHLPSRLLLARCLLRLGKPDEARKVADRAALTNPGSAEAHIVAGLVLAAANEDPRPSFRKAVEIGPSVEAHLALAEAELDFGGFAAAEAAVEAAAAIDPKAVEVQTARGNVLLARGDIARAEVAYRRALEAGGARFSAQAESSRIGLAAAQYLQGRLDEADETLLRADVSSPRVSYLQGLIRLARGGGDARNARDRFSAAAQAGCARAHLGLGTHLYHDLGGDMAAARSDFLKALAAAPSDPHVAELAAWAQYRTGDRAGAAETYARLAKLAPRYAAGHAAGAAVALEDGRQAEAVRRCRTGLESCPRNGQLLAALGLAQIAAGDPGAAATSLRQSLAAGCAGPDVYLGLAHLANAGKDLPGAARWLTSALAAASAGGSPAAEGYASEALALVTKARRLKMSFLGFDGGPRLPKPLRADARFGVAAKVAGGELVVAGTQTKIDGGRTRAHANADAGVLGSVAAEVRVPDGGVATAGVFIESRNGCVELARTPVGAAAFRAKDGRDAPWGAWQTLVRWPADGRMRLEIAILETKMNLARLEVRAERPLPGAGETPVARVVELKNALWRERALSVGAFAAAPVGTEVDARFDNFALVNRTESAAP